MKCNIQDRAVKSSRGIIREVKTLDGSSSLLYNRLKKAELDTLPQSFYTNMQKEYGIPIETNSDKALAVYTAVRNKVNEYPTDENAEPYVTVRNGKLVPDIPATNTYTNEELSKYRDSESIFDQANQIEQAVEQRNLGVNEISESSINELNALVGGDEAYKYTISDKPSFFYKNFFNIDTAEAAYHSIRLGENYNSILSAMFQRALAQKLIEDGQIKGVTPGFNLLSYDKNKKSDVGNAKIVLNYLESNNIDTTSLNKLLNYDVKYENTGEAADTDYETAIGFNKTTYGTDYKLSEVSMSLDPSTEDDIPPPENMNEAQEKAYDLLMQTHSQIEQKGSGKYIYRGSSKPTVRQSQLLKEVEGPAGTKGFYGAVTEEAKSDDEAQISTPETIRGDQVDATVDFFIQGMEKEEAYNALLATDSVQTHGLRITREVFDRVYDQAANVFNNPTSKYLTQVRVAHDIGDRIMVGTADVIEILEDGTLRFYDVKTSKYPFTTNYRSESGYVNNYSKGFSKNGVSYASKRQVHGGQLTFYANAAVAKGSKLTSKDSLNVFPVYFSDIDENTQIAEEVEFEKNTLGIAEDMNITGQFFNDISREIEGTSLTTTQLSTMLNKIKQAISKQVKQIQFDVNRSKDQKSKDLYFVNKSLTDIEAINDVHALIEYLNSVANKLLGGTFVKNADDPETRQEIQYKGVLERIKSDYDFIKEDGKMSLYDKFALLENHQKTLELYKDMVDDSKDFVIEYNRQIKEDQGETEDQEYREALINRLRETQETYNVMLAQIKELKTQLATSWIATANSDEARTEKDREDLDPVINTIRKDINELEDKRTKGLISEKKYLKEKAALEKRLFRLDESKMKKSSIKELQEITQGLQQDISYWTRWLMPAVFSSNKLLSLFAKKLKEQLEGARRKDLNQLYVSEKAFNEFMDNAKPSNRNPAVMNKKFMEIRQVKNSKGEMIDRYHFKTEFDYVKYDKARQEHMDNLKIDPNQSEELQKRNAARSWYYRNTVAIMEDLTIEDPYSPGEKIVIRKGIDTIVKEKKEELRNEYGDTKMFLESTQEWVLRREYEYKKWYKAVYSDVHGWKIAESRIPNEKYRQNLNLTPAEKKFRDHMYATYYRAQETYPKSKRLYDQIPSVPKSDYDRVTDNGLASVVKDKVSELKTNFDERTEETYGTMDSQVPILFSSKNLKAEDTSQDLLSSILLYSSAANNYKVRVRVKSIAESVKESIKANPPRQVDNKGRRIVNNLAAKVGFSNNSKEYFNESDNNRLLQALDDFVQSQIYGEFRKRQDAVSPAMVKILDTVTAFQSRVQMGLTNPFSTVPNAFNALLNARLESIAGGYFNRKQYSQASKDMVQLERDMLSNVDRVKNRTKHMLLVDLYDPVQGSQRDEYGRRVTHSKWKKLRSDNTWYWAMQKGDQVANMRMFFALMRSKEVYNKDNPSDKMSFMDALEKDPVTGVLKLKSGYGYINAEGNFTTDVYDPRYQNRAHAISKRLFGVYNSFDMYNANRGILGRLALTYRKHLPEGFRSRFANTSYATDKALSYNEELEDYTVGSYVALVRYGQALLRNMNNMQEVIKTYNYLTKQEKYAARKAMSELLTAMILYAVYLGIKALEGDDEDEYYMSTVLMYMALRGRSEMMTYVNPIDLVKSFRAPFMTYNTALRISAVLAQLVTNPFEVYDQKSGFAQKGDSKLLIKMFKVVGIKGWLADPSQPLQLYESMF